MTPGFSEGTHKYAVHHCFENNQLLILKIFRLDLNSESDTLILDHWLSYDKTSSAMVKLWERSKDSSPYIEERYFEQGYLKFNEYEATFIEKYNAGQHQLIKSK